MQASRASSNSQGDLFKGLRLWTEPSGRQRLEGTVRNAAKYTGLAERTIHHLIEAGQIEKRQPGSNRSDAAKPDALGRSRRYKCFVNMRDVFRIAYGKEKAREMLEAMGLGYG